MSEENISRKGEEPEKRIVWMKCRATSESRGEPVCLGNQAEVLTNISIPNSFGSSGNLSRYRCVICGRMFTIRT